MSTSDGATAVVAGDSTTTPYAAVFVFPPGATAVGTAWVSISYRPEFALACNVGSASTNENGQPNCCATLSFTKSSGCGGCWSSMYLFSFQVFTTPPRFEISTK